MMHLFDNHNHSQFSFDGKRSSVEECAYAAQSAGLSGMAFTDHCDFFVPAMKAASENLVPEVFDVTMQQEEIDRVQKMYPSVRIQVWLVYSSKSVRMCTL